MNPVKCPYLASLDRIVPSGRIYLIGGRASGKTTAGRLLAASLGYGFCDLDARLCAREGRDVAEIVAAGGWPQFRRIESEVLREASLESNMVFATGGGVILAPENRDFLKKSGEVVWLDAPAPILAERLAKNPLHGQRPDLTGKGLVDEVCQIMAERAPLYARTCSRKVDASRAPEEVCLAIIRALGLNV